MYRKVRQYASIFDHFSMIEPNHDHSLIRKFGMDKSMDFKIKSLSIEFIVATSQFAIIFREHNMFIFNFHQSSGYGSLVPRRINAHHFLP